ncbi:unnamed protein product, partial [Ectocarpus fasciculatus]
PQRAARTAVRDRDRGHRRHHAHRATAGECALSSPGPRRREKEAADAMRAAGRKQQQSRQPRNSTTACLVTLLSGGGGSMAAAAAAYTPSRSSRASSLAAGVVPAFAARVSSSLASKRNGDREMGSGRTSLVAVGRRTSGRGRRINDRGVSTAVSMSAEGWKMQPRALGLPGGAFSRGEGWPPAVGDRRRTLAMSAATTEGGGRFDSAELLKMGYRDLQKLAKENNVRANQAGDAIINDLVALGGNPAREPDGNGEGIAVPATGESSDWVAGVLDEDIMAGVDLEADGEDDAGDQDSETYAQAVKRATSGKFTATDMEGLKGGVDRGDGWVTFKLGKGDALGLDGEGDDDYLDDDDDYDDEESGGGGDDMDARIRDAEASKFRLSPEMMASSAEDFGFGRDAADLEKLTITVPTGCCPGCGSKFQSEDPASPGFLQLDKLDGLLGNEGGASTEKTAEGAGEAAPAPATEEADMDPEAWLEAQSDINTDLDFDLDLADEDDDGDGPREEWAEGSYASPATAPAGGG